MSTEAETALAEALMDAGPDLMGWSTGGNLHSGDARTILAALAARGWRLYQFDNPTEVAGGVAIVAAREPAGAGLREAANIGPQKMPPDLELWRNALRDVEIAAAYRAALDEGGQK